MMFVTVVDLCVCVCVCARARALVDGLRRTLQATPEESLLFFFDTRQECKLAFARTNSCNS